MLNFGPKIGPGGQPEARRAKWPFLGPKTLFSAQNQFLCTSSNFFVTIMTRHQKDNVFVLLMLLSKLQGACKSPFLAQKWPENQIFMLSIVLHGIVWYCMEFLCILWYRIVFMSFHCIVWYCMVLYYILQYCMVLHCWRGLYLARHLSTLYNLCVISVQIVETDII